MLLHLEKYDYTILYKPRKEMVLADCLSQFPSRKEYTPKYSQHTLCTRQIEHSQRSCRERFHTQHIYRLTLNGWPYGIQEVPRIACHFWGTWDELTIENGILLKGERVCIPPELYERMLSDLHGNHRENKKMRHLSQTTVYWPGIDTDIADYVN